MQRGETEVETLFLAVLLLFVMCFEGKGSMGAGDIIILK